MKIGIKNALIGFINMQVCRSWVHLLVLIFIRKINLLEPCKVEWNLKLKQKLMLQNAQKLKHLKVE